MTAPEWDWLIEQAAELGLPPAAHVRNLLKLVAPVAQDRDQFWAVKRALFEARMAAFGWMREIVRRTYAEFERDPVSFVPAAHRANPDTLASNPAWEEPDADRR
jgi:hypothetical protein